MRETFWLKGKETIGDGWHSNYTTFWRMLCYKDTKEPVTGEKIEINYDEYIES